MKKPEIPLYSYPDAENGVDMNLPALDVHDSITGPAHDDCAISFAKARLLDILKDIQRKNGDLEEELSADEILDLIRNRKKLKGHCKWI